MEPAKLHSRLKLFGKNLEPNFEWFCYEDLKMNPAKIRNCKMQMIMYNADEKGLAGVAFVFITGMASAPDDVIFSDHFATPRAENLKMQSAKLDTTKPVRRLGMGKAADGSIMGFKIMSSETETMTEVTFVENSETQWQTMEVPEGKTIVGVYGRKEEQSIVSLGFIVI